LKGTLIWFNPEKHHGFIRTEDGDKLLVEEDGFEPGHLLGDRCRGTQLLFDRVERAGGEPCAMHVTVVPLEAARRARARKH
jgi:'Cold-shock' DNA-binding domain